MNSEPLSSFLTWGILTVLTALLAAALGLLMAFPVMWLWNAFVPVVIGWQAIDWTQALCLYVLCSVLFKSSGGGSK